MLPITTRELALATRGSLLRGAQNTVLRGVSVDSRTLKTSDIFVPLKGKNHDGHAFFQNVLEKGASGFLTEVWDKATERQLRPALTDDTVIVKVQDALRALQDIAHHVRSKKGVPVVGITGSTGKTCTKDMLASILKQEFQVVSSNKNFNNEIGVPLTLLDVTQETQVIVLEMAMRASGEIAELSDIAHPNIGVITNIGQAHLEFLGSEQAIFEAKSELVRAIPSDGAVILNQDDTWIDQLMGRASASVTTFGQSGEADIVAEEIRRDSLGRVTFGVKGLQKYVIINLPVPGRYQVSNALAALSAAKLLGASLTAIKEGLEKFVACDLRMEIFSTPEGMMILNDTYNANPASMAAALRTLSEIDRDGARRMAILGDMLELGDFSQVAHLQVGRLVMEAGVDYLITVGKESQKIAEGAVSSGMNRTHTYSVRRPQDAAGIVTKVARPGDIILLKASRAVGLERALDGFASRKNDD